MPNSTKKIAIACQGGGTHAAFEAGVLTEVLQDIERRNRFELIAISGTSAGALCAMMVGYGLAEKRGRQASGSCDEAVRKINSFWDDFAASMPAEIVHNAMSMAALQAQEMEIPVLGIKAPIWGLNPSGILDDAIILELEQAGARKTYCEFGAMLDAACPDFDTIEWTRVHTRVLVGASEVLDGVETVFDSACRPQGPSLYDDASVSHRWRARLPLSLQGVAASGTLPGVREAERIGRGFYWDGLYSQNPPIRELIAGVPKEAAPDEIWVLRINPQQCARPPRTNAEGHDRENELMGNLSLNKELDFILTVNELLARYPELGNEYKPVTIRTIKMTEETADQLRAWSKFDRSRSFIDRLRAEGSQVAKAWLGRWPDVDCWPNDAAYH